MLHVSQASAQDKLSVAKAETMKGFIGQRLDNSYKNGILAQDAPYLVEPFRKRNENHLWQSEFWGKWVTSAVLAYRYKPTPDLKRKLEETVRDLISTQTPDGYIGNYAKESRLQQWDIWGRKYCMLGLLDYHSLTGDKKSLLAARGVADNLMADLRNGSFFGAGTNLSLIHFYEGQEIPRFRRGDCAPVGNSKWASTYQ